MLCLHYKDNPQTLSGEIIAVYSENHVKHLNTLCMQYAEFLNIRTDGIYNNYSALKGDESYNKILFGFHTQQRNDNIR
jgi:hypothetical protein